MKANYFIFLLMLAIGTHTITAQSAEISRLQRAKKATAEHFKHLKACLEGKELCTPANFAEFGAAILFVYAILSGLRWGLLSQFTMHQGKAHPNVDRKSIPYKVTTYIDPFHQTAGWIGIATARGKHKFQNWRNPVRIGN